MFESMFPALRRKKETELKSPQNIFDLFDEMWRQPFWGMEQFTTGFVPAVEVSEKEDEIVVRAEIPGLDTKDLYVAIENNYLVIKGEKKREKKMEKENFVHMECSYGSFYRTIPLTSEVDKDKIKATYKKGVLTITLPKVESARARRIAIDG